MKYGCFFFLEDKSVPSCELLSGEESVSMIVLTFKRTIKEIKLT